MAEMVGLEMIYRDSYDLEYFLRKTVYSEEDRCRFCYGIRLKASANEASRKGFKTFSTTLLYSRYQNLDSIIEIGDAIGKGYGLDFYIEDFRKGWKKGIETSHKMGLYRQKYCGCIYSEKERYLN